MPNPLRPRLVRTALLAAAALLLAGRLEAQVVRGQVVNPGGNPVKGALVLLLDEAGVQRGAALVNPQGRFVIRAPAGGRYRLRAEVVGLPSATSPVMELVQGQTREARLEISAQAVALEPLRSDPAGRGRCQTRPGTGDATSLIWEEARKALRSNAHVQEAELVRYEVVQYRRDLDAQSLAVKGEERTQASRMARTPFASIPARELSAGGYVQKKEDGTFYYGPDAQVLLSDEFLADHCFEIRPQHPGDPALIGLGFRPASGRTVADVEGVLWLDLSSSELRYLEYRYTGLPGSVPADKLGGQVEFERLEGGAWIVKKWWIRMPAMASTLHEQRRFANMGQVDRERRESLVGIREEGGEVTTAAQQASRAMVGATLSGVVWDSIGNRALPGAAVFVSGTQFTARADSTGAFVLDGVPAGQHTVSFTHPAVAALGLFPSRTLNVQEGDAIGLDLAIPSGATAAAQLCPDRAKPGVGIVAGEVRDEAGQPAAGAKVVVTWRQRGASERETVRDGVEETTDASGFYRACGVPADVTLHMEATRGALKASAQTRLSAGSARQDFRLGAAAPAGRRP
jgi:Carboxypeptidase regulatory-like domain